jgi:hypothetical protein
MSFHAPKEFMIRHPFLGLGEGNNGFFKFVLDGVSIYVQASEGLGWEHVSVSTNKNRCPSWGEMCFIKNYFWDEDDCVIQFHPPKSQYVNNHNYCLHMWKPIDKAFPMPESILVGIK